MNLTKVVGGVREDSCAMSENPASVAIIVRDPSDTPKPVIDASPRYKAKMKSVSFIEPV